MTILIPQSTIIVTLTAIGLASLSNLVTRLFVDLRTERRLKAEAAQFMNELKEAKEKGDKGKEEKLMKKKPQMDKMKAKAQFSRTKILLITWVPFISVYYFIGTIVLGGVNTPVAISPIPLPFIVNANGEIVLFWWYMISSFSFSSIISKVMGTAP